MERVEGRTMVIHKLLLKVMVLGIIILGPYHNHAAEALDIITKPGCQSFCGNISIPFPFGLSDSSPDCHLNSTLFIVNCDYSVDPPIPYWLDFQLRDISVEDHELRTYFWTAQDCYNSSGLDRSSSAYPRFILAFPMSSTKNKFTVIGCDTSATLHNTRQQFSFGCMSSCSSDLDVSSGLCTGMGCCETSIPRNSYDYSISVTSFSNHSKVLDFNPCSYAFVVENGFYNFSVSDLRQLKHFQSAVVLDWAIGSQKCEDAKKNSTSYMCKNKTTCTDAENGSGYKCACLEGYQGNPYLVNGCQDIDECADPMKNPCEGKCHNVDGSYTCSCPKGYYGNGEKGSGAGQGCTAKPSNLMEILVGVGTGIGSMVLLLLCWWSYKYIGRRREAKLKQKFFMRNGGFLLRQRLSSVEDNHMEKGKLFTSTELDTVTDHFNENRILGRGGQGTVYKGMLMDGTIIAVKKSKVIDAEQVEQFINEVVILSEINHRNVAFGMTYVLSA